MQNLLLAMQEMVAGLKYLNVNEIKIFTMNERNRVLNVYSIQQNVWLY